MGLNDTPRGNRLHIGIFGRRNAGKSSMINALTGQERAIVSDTPGTTADPVYKSMELHPIGPVVFIDTAGFDDEGDLGKLRVAKTNDTIGRTDVAILVLDAQALSKCSVQSTRSEQENQAVRQEETQATRQEETRAACLEESWAACLKEASVPTITVINKWDALADEARADALKLAESFTDKASLEAPIPVSSKTGEGIDSLRAAIQNAVPEEFMAETILGELVTGDSLVLLVMPQDIQAPKGRLILPQVQTIRELLDRKCTVMATTADAFAKALAALSREPDLIITDSQCFDMVYKQKPEGSDLTSFSILMAAAKGDINTFVKGAYAIDGASAIDDAHVPFRVLIAEACTHVPLKEDIGTVKIPMLLHKKFGDDVVITNVRGDDFPNAEGLKQYDLIIHCGACMFNRKHVMNRIAAAKKAGVPITNYGIFLAKMAGILDKVCLP